MGGHGHGESDHDDIGSLILESRRRMIDDSARSKEVSSMSIVWFDSLAYPQMKLAMYMGTDWSEAMLHY